MLKPIIAICDAFVELLDPLVEVVIHDLTTNTIHYINGHLSKRKVGDDSLLDIDALHQNNWEKLRYNKLSFDGRLVKSISIPLEPDQMLCLNCDVSVFQQMQTLSQALLHHNPATATQPKPLFDNDWQEKLHQHIHQYIDQHNWIFGKLNTAQKKTIIKELFIQNAFEQKKAADYIASILKMGRATIYNYLREWRKNETL